MERTKALLYAHLTQYPGMQPEDCLALLYQSELAQPIGADYADALEQELRLPGLITAQPYEPEPLGGPFSRVYLSGFDKGPCVRTFASMAALNAEREGTMDGLQDKLRLLRTMGEEGLLPYPSAEVELVVNQYILEGGPPPAHSGRYVGLYAPHYRVLRRDAALFLPVFAAIDRALAQKPHVLVGIDGMSAAGKSSLAAMLQRVYGCGVVHTDDFFLQPSQRNAQRLLQPGGNIDYERLAPVAQQAADDRGFRYQKYDCTRQELAGWQEVPGGPITLLEGVYALHPKVKAACDVTVFLYTDAATQSLRLGARNPELYGRFMAEWLPMENHYFTQFSVREGCDIAIDTTAL